MTILSSSEVANIHNLKLSRNLLSLLASTRVFRKKSKLIFVLSVLRSFSRRKTYSE